MTSKKDQNSKKEKETKLRAEPGEISCPALKDGSLRFNIPKAHTVDKKKQLQKRLGLKETPENRAVADLITVRLNERIKAGDYDPEKLDEYINEYEILYMGDTSQDTPSPRSYSPSRNKTLTLDKLWEEFCQYKIPFIKETTFAAIFSTIGSHISKLSTKNLSEADTIVAELYRLTKSESAFYRTLTYISNCCNWAIDRDKISKNPFKHALSILKQPDTDADPDPFTREGERRVIAAYEKHARYCHYVPFIKFRFKTGCRIAEAVGLKWKHINLKEGYIEFCETITSTAKGFKHRKGTKTELSRLFPISSVSLRQLLEAQKPPIADPEAYVFTEPNGKHINYNKFHYSWYGRKSSSILKDGTKKIYPSTGIVYCLAELPEEEGGIDHYRPPYSPRHSYITFALDKQARKKEIKLTDVAQLAEYVGTSPDMIFEHYLGRSGDTSIADTDEENIDSASTNLSQQSSKLLSSIEDQLVSKNQLIEQLTQQISQITEQNQILQQQLAQLVTLHISSQQNKSTPEASEQSEPIIPSESDVNVLTLMLALGEQIGSSSASFTDEQY